MKILKLTCVVILAALVTQVQAQPLMDTFSTGIEGSNQLIPYENSAFPNTGWNGGEWVYYPETGWWNEWFYDHPPDPLRWKVIQYDMEVFLDPAIMEPIFPEIAINWSSIDYPETGPSGVPPLASDEQFIERFTIFNELLDPNRPFVRLEGTFTIPDYNPEWISIDIRAEPIGPTGAVAFVEGTIWHECVPEPAALALLLLGGMALLRKR